LEIFGRDYCFITGCWRSSYIPGEYMGGSLEKMEENLAKTRLELRLLYSWIREDEGFQ
jgi:hypothetical protein